MPSHGYHEKLHEPLLSADLISRLQKVDPRDFALIRDDFGVYLHGLGYSPYTIAFYQRRLLRLANWMAEDRLGQVRRFMRFVVMQGA